MDKYKQIPNTGNSKLIQTNTGRMRYLESTENLAEMSVEKLSNYISKVEGYPPQYIDFVKTNLDLTKKQNLTKNVLEVFGDNPISYKLIENDQDLNYNQGSLLKDTINENKLKRLQKVYPFCTNSPNGLITVPNWTKEILYDRMTLSNADKIIKFNNYGGDAIN